MAGGSRRLTQAWIARDRSFPWSITVVALLLTMVTAACTPELGLSSDPTPSPSSTRTAPEPSPFAGGSVESACLTGGGGGDTSSKINYSGASASTLRPSTLSPPGLSPPGLSSEGLPSRGRSSARLGGAGGFEGAGHAAEAGRRAEPRADRPVVRLCFDIPADRKLVTGHESVTFTAQERICEAVFRAWPNKPETAWTGNRLEVLGVKVGKRAAQPTVEQAGAPEGAPGTLIRVPLPDCAPKGRRVTIELDFSVALGRDTPERVGYSQGDLTAWLATAYPLLAWERGAGWATEPAVELFGETVTSEVFELAELRVIAPAEDDVLGVGEPLGSRPGPRPGTTEHRFAAPAIRDVAVSVGRFEMKERTVGDVQLHVAALPGSEFPVTGWADHTVEAVRHLSELLGPFPYDHLWVTVVPDIGSGIEFPGAIQFGDVDPERYSELVPHEVAHMWFYGLVGNNQARDPWLDESFAEYAELMVSGEIADRAGYRAPEPVRYEVGRSMRWYDDFDQPDLYGQGVYRQGAAMLVRAREAVGAATFDRLLRDYIDANAYRVATDADVREAFASEPEALAVFERYGAFID